MKGREVLFSHANDEWCTPDWLFWVLNQEFGFNADAAATDENAKCNCYFTKEHSALTSDWSTDTIFLNPPYSKIYPFMKKAYEASLNGAIVVCLIPIRSDTKYWHEFCMKADEIRFIKRRVKFSNPYKEKTSSATFPSVVVIFNYWNEKKSETPLIGKTIDKKEYDEFQKACEIQNRFPGG